MADIYENICFYANKRGMSIRSVEEKANIGNGTIGKWKNADPGLKKIQQVAEALEVSVTTLLKEKRE